MIPHFAPLYPAYYTTYYGDIYHGRPVDLFNDQKAWYILSNNQINDFRNLKPEERTSEKFSELAWEVRDNDIINWKKVYADFDMGNKDNHLNLQRTKYRKCKKLFIFGAGASANCIYGNTSSSFLKPPLGYEILNDDYSEIIRKYPGAYSNITYFDQNGKDIEAAMEKEWEIIRTRYSPEIIVSHINLQYYLFELFNKISEGIAGNYKLKNLYSAFAKSLLYYLSGKHDEFVSIVSFNYDTILESQLSNIFHIAYNNMQDYVDLDNRQIALFKPHGSSNWGWRFNKTKISDIGSSSIADYLLKKKYTLDTIYYDLLGKGDIMDMVAADSWGYEQNLHKHHLGRYTINKNKIEVIPAGTKDYYYPALLLPYRDKDEFLMHYDHQAELGYVIPEIEEIYIIGWKGNEDVFNRFIQRRAHQIKKLVIVNPVELTTHEVEKNLRNHGIQLNNLKNGIEVVQDFGKFIQDVNNYLT